MEFYDKVDDQYLNMIKRPIHLWRIKLELLDHDETTVMCIEKDIDYSNAGSISGNYTQGTRKTCSITLINVDLKYIPTEDSPFWFNRKFRIYLGLVDNRHYKQASGAARWTNETDTYWFSKGVYITQDIHVDSTTHTVSISGVDKYAQLDGSLNVLQADEMNTVYEYGSPIISVIRDTLMLDMGNGKPLDPIEPMVDTGGLDSAYLYKDFTLSAGQYYGDFFNELATSYGAEIYYDNKGRLVMRRLFSDDFPYAEGFKAPVQEFKYHLPGYQNSQESIKLTGVNKIIVATDNVETPNGSYTAINTNPRSPLCYNKIGARTLPENGGVVIINAGNIVTEEAQEEDPTLVGESEDLVNKRCRDYAEYRLMQETCLGTSISFNCLPYLHMNEGDVVVITDPDFALDCDLYIINSITFPLGADAIQLEVSNLGFLNSDISNQTSYSGLESSPIKFGIHYITGEVTGTPPPNQLIEIGHNFTTPTDYDEETFAVSFEKENHELMGWKDNINEDTYALNAEYAIPNQSVTMRAIWENYEDYIMEYRVRDVAGAGYNYYFNDIVNRQIDGDQSMGEDLYSTAFFLNNDKKHYFYGRDFPTISYVSDVVEQNLVIKYGYVPITQGTKINFNGQETNIINSGTNGGYTYYVKYPNMVKSFTLNGYLSYVETLIFPKYAETLTVNISSSPNLTYMDFNNENELSIVANNHFIQTSNDNLRTIKGINHIDIKLYPTANFICIFKGSYNAPTVTFEGGITIDQNSLASNPRCHFLYFTGTNAKTELTTITIGSVTRSDPYMGGLELVRVDMAEHDLGDKIDILIDKLYMDGSSMCKNIRVGNVLISDNIKIINGSELLSGTIFFGSEMDTFNVSGDYLYIDSSTFFCNTNVPHINIQANVVGRSTTGGFNIFNDLQFLESIHFYGEIDIDCNNEVANVLISNNPLLTDVYFHDDTFSITNIDSQSSIFSGNNANFKIHGIADGNVQAFCTANSIPFEVIVDE